MSAQYSLMLVTKEFQAVPKAISWLEDVNLVLPDKLIEGRNPTGLEMRSVLQKMQGFSVDYEICSDQLRHWRAKVYKTQDIDSENIIWIEVVWYTGDETDPQHFTFTGDESLIMRVVQALTKWCGTSILMVEGEPVAVITPQS